MRKTARRLSGVAPTTRRQFLQGLSGVTFTLSLSDLGSASAAMSPRPDSSRTPPVDLNAYVNLSPDGVVTILTPSAEMGQGTMTALPLILAEEMDVDWNDVRTMPTPPAGDEFGDPLFLNMIYSAASRAAQIYFERLRIFGAQARKVLLINAADRLQVPLEELATERSKVIHARSGAELTYAEIAAFATVPDALPEIGPADLKDPADFRLIGTQVPRRDLPAKTIGQAEYSIDVQLPGLVHAAVSRAPVIGLSNALYETVTIKRGVPRETNFHEYRIMQLPAAPEVSVSLIPSMLPPTGIREAGTVVAPAALANALAAWTGRRLRHLPFTPERVRTLMA